MTEVKAHTRFLRMSPRKVRLVVDAVRGLAVGAALDQLRFMAKAAARPVRKLIESAVANAEHNFKLEKDGLYIKAAYVNQGPTLKRWRPRAMGAAAPILKRTSHVTVILATKGDAEAKPAKKTAKKAAEAPAKKAETAEAEKKTAAPKKAPAKKAKK